jgi:hypothetical protein
MPARIESNHERLSALDELFLEARRYRTSRAFRELLLFVARFRTYSPYNAMLLHVQRPGAQFVAPAGRWLEVYRRRVRPEANPLVILQPRGPVMFVFDVSDTDPLLDAPALPVEVTDPFGADGALDPRLMERTIDNAKRDGVRVAFSSDGSRSAGRVSVARPGAFVERTFAVGNKTRVDRHEVHFDLVVNGNLSPAAQYATMLHELAHLYCGHLGTPTAEWWPDRRNLGHELEELEAECAAYLVCARTDIDPASNRYLSTYLPAAADVELPPVSLEAILKVAGLLESMGHTRQPARRPPTPQKGQSARP